MVNDGSYYFIRALKQGFPFIPNRRMIHDPTQRPLIFAAQFISDLGVLQSVFSLAYALIPLLSLAAAWYVVRKDDRSLFLWAALGILIAPLPVQFFHRTLGLVVLAAVTAWWWRRRAHGALLLTWAQVALGVAVLLNAPYAERLVVLGVAHQVLGTLLFVALLWSSGTRAAPRDG